MAFNFASIHKRILATLIGFASKILSSRGVLKIPVFLLILPAGLLLTIMAMIVIACLLTVLFPFYVIRYFFWRLSAKGRMQYIQEKYQRRKQKAIAFQQRRRLKLSQGTDKADLKFLVKLSKNEIIQRRQYVDHIIFIETKRRLNRCLDEMNFADALHIYSAIVDSELDLLNESLNELFH